MPAHHRSRGRVAAVAVLVVLALVAAGCASDDKGAGDRGGDERTGASGTAPDGGDKKGSCDQGPTTEGVEAEPVDGVDSDFDVTSFDGTEIRVHWYPTPGAGEMDPAPTVLMGPGWSLAGDTSVGGAPLFGALSRGGLNTAGYNVLTWDPRGFGRSGGSAMVNDPDHEGRDVQVLLDWVAEQPEAQTDGPGDPRSGMVGFSYGGGIQLTVAGVDCRVDALVPGLAWHSLETSLYKAETVKAGWAGVLVTAGDATGTLDPHIHSAARSGLGTGTLSPEDEEWFRARGPGELVDEIEVPTLFVQGSTDTLFTLDEAITNESSLRSRDVPTGMLWFCGGHGVCLTEGADTEWVADASLAWLDRWVKGDDSVELGPAFEVVDQQGQRWTGDGYPSKPDTVATVEATDAGTLELRADGGSGPVTVPPEHKDLLSTLVGPITPAPADNAVEVALDGLPDEGLALGAPTVELTYTGTSPEGTEPTRVFAQIVDEARGIVVGTLVTPIAVTLDGKEHTVTVDLEAVVHDVSDPTDLTLQLVATTVAYAVPRLGGKITFSDISVTVPIVTSLTER